MEKVRYEIDPHNRLVARSTGNETEVGYFRQILDGRFKIGDGNSLVYHVKKSAGIDIPQQIKFRGSWSLDEEHNLIFTLDKWNNQVEGNRFILKGELLDASDNELVFSVTTKDRGALERVYVLKFTGAWQADEHNRLVFNVEKEKGPCDALTLQGIWNINKQNELIYTYTKTQLETKQKSVNMITFKGWWDISENNRITYVLNKEIPSRFDPSTAFRIPPVKKDILDGLHFKVVFEKAGDKYLKYSVGIGAVPEEKSITLFGRWRLDDRKGISFEIEYQDKKIQSILFGADCRLGDGNKLELTLKNKLGEDLGIELKLSRALLDGAGEGFIKALASRKEIFIGAGAGIKF